MRTILLALTGLAAVASPARAGMTTWDGRHAIDAIEVTVVYFVPADRVPLPDWRERVDYYARRIERFHAREFGGQSVLTASVRPELFRSKLTTAELREGDADKIFFRTLREADAALQFGRGERKGFPILLMLSDINWRPLDDFWRLKPEGDGYAFEGQLIDGLHHPGATSGGARATYLADRGVGWGLVSADGWRVPYRGSDCVVYHEGVGHAIGLPHPEPANGSVMSMGQYQGWLSESWVDEAQKRRLGWEPPKQPADRTDLFSVFRTLPAPRIPTPGDEAGLKFDWPAGTKLKSFRVRVQTDLFGPWLDVAATPGKDGAAPANVSLGRIDRPAPVNYRVDAETVRGESAELWGYFQVRSAPDAVPLPLLPLAEFATAAAPEADEPAEEREEIDLLALVDPGRDGVSGEWSKGEGRLESPKAYGARIELPYVPPPEYRVTVIAEPLDEPNGLILGQRSGENRFLALLNYGEESALENVDGQNVGNDTTHRGKLFEKGRPAEVVCEVRRDGVRVTVDGRTVIRWRGDPSRLSLGDYWKTPHAEALFLGAYDCRYRFHRVGLTPITGEGRALTEPDARAKDGSP